MREILEVGTFLLRPVIAGFFAVMVVAFMFLSRNLLGGGVAGGKAVQQARGIHARRKRQEKCQQDVRHFHHRQTE